MADRNREFYVGYLPTAPAGIGRVVRIAVGVALATGVTLAAAVAGRQTGFSPAAFEFGRSRTLNGTLTLDPLPSLLVARSGQTGGQAAVSRYLLTGPGKHGARNLIAEFDGRATILEGSLAYRDGTTMVEIEPGTVVASGEVLMPPIPVMHGTVSVQGEVVDGKCYLGVMNPGEGKPHRGCAARCISGGAPPILIARTETGDHHHLVMVGYDTEDLLAFVAEPVEVTGELFQSGDTWMLNVATGSIRRIQ